MTIHDESQDPEPQTPLPNSNTKLHQNTQQPTPSASVCNSHYVAWESAPNPKSHFSIGDQGATASINAYGQMMLFRNFLGAEPSGFISLEQFYESISKVDHSMADDYNRAERAKQLEWMSRNPLPMEESAFGLKFPGLETGKELPRLSLLRYRWPRYQYRTDKWELDIHWMIHDDHLLQQCIVTNLEPSPLDVEFKFCNPGSSMVVRVLDLNPTGRGCFQNSSRACPDGYGWFISTREFVSRQTVPKRRRSCFPSSSYARPTEGLAAPLAIESVAVVVSVFLNGEPMRWKAATSAWTHRLEAKTNNNICPSSNTMEVIVAYCFRHSNNLDADLETTSIPVAAVQVTEFLRKEPFSPIRISETDIARRDDFQNFPSPDPTINGVDSLNENTLEAFGETASPDKHIEFLIRRHLEHILSVCAIPVQHSLPKPVEVGTAGPKPRRGAVPIALTCGDMSGHVIYASSSFFAFMFLLEAASRLKRIHPVDTYVSAMLVRISTVCEGHMEWLKLAELDEGLFSLDYWPTGKTRVVYRSYLFRHIRLLDNSFRIIKAGEFAKVYNEPNTQELARAIVDKVWECWVEKLRLSDKRSISVWPHWLPKRYDLGNEFRLSDQLWIWKALSIVEEMGISPPSNPDSQKRGVSEPPQSFTPRGLQRDIVKRFTTENPLIKQRTLAVTRSARRVRFTLHAQDTVLLYGEDWGFFHRETKSWSNLINLQKICVSNKAMEWDNALRYGLALMMGVRQYSISGQHPRELTKSAFSRLINVSGQNGFFPGKLDFETNEPIQPQTYRDEVLSFNTSFQIPFILFMNALQISEAYQGLRKIDYELPMSDEPNNMCLKMESPIQLKTEKSDSKPNSEAACWLEKYSLLSPQNDPMNIIGIYEEEWLYDYPRFFSSEKLMSQEDFRDTVEEMRKYKFGYPCSTITRGMGEYLLKVRQDPRLSEKGTNSPVAGWGAFDDVSETARVFDAAKKRPTGRIATPIIRQLSDSCCSELQATNSALWKHIGGPRDALYAKRRFIWLYRADRGTALACFMSNPEFRRYIINGYFDRHSQYEKFFLDEVNKLSNIWRTEFHLSFHRLLRPGESKDAGIPERREETLPGRKKKQIVKCSIGFYFTGDFFDKHWTCYLAEYPKMEAGSLLVPCSHFDLDRGRLWSQRKILELRLFDRIMTKLLEGATEIYKEIAREFGFRNDVFTISITDSEDYFSRDWLRLQHMLEAIELDLTESTKIIQRWETRVSDRDGQHPRWTEKHERKYGDEVKFWTGVTNGQIKDLQHLLDKIRALKVVIIRSQEHVRGDLSLRGAENIRFFTYVTVIFLPLSFSASVMGMDGAPSGSLMLSMIIYAIISLALTFIALYNAAPVGKILKKVFQSYYKSFTDTTMQQSSLVQFPEFPSPSDLDRDALNTNEAGVGSEKNLTGHPKPEEDYNAHFWFWFTYIVIELPARRVISGYNALKDGSLDWKAFYRVPIAIVMLPVCLFSFAIRVAFYNLIDLLKLTGGWVIWFFFSPYTENNKESQEHFRWLIQPPEYVRPLQKIHDNMEEMRKRWDRERAGGEEDGKPDEKPDDQVHP